MVDYSIKETKLLKSSKDYTLNMLESIFNHNILLDIL